MKFARRKIVRECLGGSRLAEWIYNIRRITAEKQILLSICRCSVHWVQGTVVEVVDFIYDSGGVSSCWLILCLPICNSNENLFFERNSWIKVNPSMFDFIVDRNRRSSFMFNKRLNKHQLDRVNGPSVMGIPIVPRLRRSLFLLIYSQHAQIFFSPLARRRVIVVAVEANEGE